MTGRVAFSVDGVAWRATLVPVTTSAKTTSNTVHANKSDAERERDALGEGFRVQALTNAHQGLRQYASVVGWRVERVVDHFGGFCD